MMNLTKFQNNLLQNNENTYLNFHLGENNYAVKIENVVEIIKLPLLDYPQRLANNAVGILLYNNFNLNVLDLRFYLNMKVGPYSVSNQILIVKTDESMFGLLIDKAGSIITLEHSGCEYLPSGSEEKIIECLFKAQDETISIINLESLETLLRKGFEPNDIDIPSLFPKDDDSRYVMTQRNQILQEKANINLAVNIFAQDKYISFRLENEIYCINLEHIKEFLKDISITPIPCNSEYISGVVAFQGNFITVIDVKKFLEIQRSEQINSPTNKNHIIVVEFSEYTVGFLVDEILSIINIPEEDIKQNEINSNKYILSESMVDNNFFNILNMENIFSDEKFFIEES